MNRRNLKPHRCDLDANGPESIHRAVELVRAFSQEHTLKPAQSAKLAVLVEEAVTNLYDHGGVTGGFCGWLELQDAATGAQVRLGDNGPPFDLRTAVQSDGPNPDRGGGAGLALIQAWADITDYRREPDGNVLELTLRS
ncbi:ATP-binding protein [Blastomonas sp. AAP53]|uniref:ATP-binding protein n=1 Tax=Blastomonas sp. AAP53 TaxID=1248760 RepID=UPI000314D858|nr:ATP-binding protein [Blastomonas sp. AAP53]